MLLLLLKSEMKVERKLTIERGSSVLVKKLVYYPKERSMLR